MNVFLQKIQINSFGKLKNTVVDCSQGINLLEAPNESGKTTLAAFVKFVFYGFAGVKIHSVIGNEKKLFMPWDGETCAGAVTLSCDGVVFRVERIFYASGKEQVYVTDRATGKQYFHGEVPGEVFFGVSEEVFSRTLFFRQLTLPAEKDEALAEQLKNIAISASEQVNSEKALDRLKTAKNSLRGRGGNGILPKAERERDALEAAITESLVCAREIETVFGDESNAKRISQDADKKLRLLFEERRGIEKYDALCRLNTLKSLSQAEKDAKAEYEEASRGFGSGDENAMSRLFSVNSDYNAEKKQCQSLRSSLDQAVSELEEAESMLPFGIEEAKDARQRIKSAKKTAKLFGFLALVLLFTGAAVWFGFGSAAGLVLMGVTVVLLACSAVFVAKPAGIAKELGLESASELDEALDSFEKNSAQLEQCKKRESEIRLKYNSSASKVSELKDRLDRGISEFISVSEELDYDEQLSDILKRSARNGELKAHWISSKEAFEKAMEGVDIGALATEAAGAEKPARDRTRVDQDINFYTQQKRINDEKALTLSTKRATLEGKYGDPAVLVGKKAATDALISEGEIQFRALDTAIKFITESGDYMKQQVAPRISERADEYFSIATDGKYNDFEVDTKLSMSFGSDFRRSCDYLSAGTRDTAYLCLRLALADMLFGGNSVPMVLDDAFVRIDSNRLASMMNAVASSAQRHQIFIFTHGDRERETLSNAGIPFSRIFLKNSQE